MKSLQFWILGAALGSFAAGMNCGLAAPGFYADVPESGADAEYMQALVADYGLSAAQHRLLRLVMQRWRDEEIAAIRSVAPTRLPPQTQRELLDARGRLEDRIRAILDEEQRARYDLATRDK
ncbi:MAG: hypothetical protein KDC98_18930 [Planctomycetes bacterium]|nr:hypothetical protein [Planctomycetota bacterium]